MERPPTLPRAITDHTTRLSQVVPLTGSAAAVRISIRVKHAWQPRPPAVPRAMPGSNVRWPKSECFQHASGPELDGKCRGVEPRLCFGFGNTPCQARSIPLGIGFDSKKPLNSVADTVSEPGRDGPFDRSNMAMSPHFVSACGRI